MEDAESEFGDYEIVQSVIERKSIYRLKRIGSDNEYYSGPRPYGIISIDGAKYDNAESFTSMAASAEILEKYYGIRQKGTLESDFIDEAKIISDYHFQKKVESLQKSLGEAQTGSKEYQELSAKIKAYQQNFQTDFFRKASKAA